VTQKYLWNSITRKIHYNPKEVCNRLRYWATQYELRGFDEDKDIAKRLEKTASYIEEGTYPVANGAQQVITAAEEFEEEVENEY
jgi:hypothetical protein